jgi:hypothetical protein
MSISMKKVNPNGVPRHHEHSDKSNGGMWILKLELTQDENYMTNLAYKKKHWITPWTNTIGINENILVKNLLNKMKLNMKLSFYSWKQKNRITTRSWEKEKIKMILFLCSLTQSWSMNAKICEIITYMDNCITNVKDTTT